MLRTPVDYTNLGYASLRDMMLDLAQEMLPEWTDRSENDLGVLLVELFAYAADINLYYQTRIASNLFPETADDPQALVQLLRLIGYELRPPAPATANLRLAIDAGESLPLTIPERSAFDVMSPDGMPLTYETVRAYTLTSNQLTPPDAENLRYFFPLPVVEGKSVLEESLGASDGSPNQLWQLKQQPLIAGSISIIVVEPGGIQTRWQAVQTLASSSPADRHFVVQQNATGVASVHFGDGSNGMIPPRGTSLNPVTVLATYRVGGGTQGNVPQGIAFRPNLNTIQSATNIQAAAGGTAAEDSERARLFAPHLYRTQERAVTAQDYTDLALQLPGVGKARAVAISWNEVVLYVAPEGQVAEPSELLRRDLLAFFESRRMVSTVLHVVAPRAADIYLHANVRANPYYLQDDVRQAVEQAVADYLAFDAIAFGQPIFLSKIYDVIQRLPEVASLTVTEFSRHPRGNLGTDGINVEADGVLELAPDELPRPGYRDNLTTLFNAADPTYRPTIATTIQGGVA